MKEVNSTMLNWGTKRVKKGDSMTSLPSRVAWVDSHSCCSKFSLLDHFTIMFTLWQLIIADLQLSMDTLSISPLPFLLFYSFSSSIPFCLRG